MRSDVVLFRMSQWKGRGQGNIRVVFQNQNVGVWGGHAGEGGSMQFNCRAGGKRYSIKKSIKNTKKKKRKTLKS